MMLSEVARLAKDKGIEDRLVKHLPKISRKATISDALSNYQIVDD